MKSTTNVTVNKITLEIRNPVKMEKIKLNTKNKKIAKTGSWLSRYLHKVKV